MDSRLCSKNLNSPLVSSALICHRTIKHVTTASRRLVPSPAVVQQPMSHKAALAHLQHWETHLSEPRLSFHVTTQQRSTVLCRAGIIQFHPHPRQASQFHFTLAMRPLHPSNFWQATIHSKINCSLSTDLKASLRLLTSPKVSTTPATEQEC